MTRDDLLAESVAELRRLAGRQGVTGASRMKKTELAAAIADAMGLAEREIDPLTEELEQTSVAKLRRMALDHGVRGAARMNKETLLSVLPPALSAQAEAGGSEVAEAREAAPPAAPPAGLPDSYGVDRVVLMVRDPEWLYTYWDISSDTWLTLIQRGITHPGNGWRPVLRLYDVTGAGDGVEVGGHLAEYELDELAREWYLTAPAAGRAYLIEFGYCSATGEFLLIARSNSVHVPRKRPSEVADERWGHLYDEAYRLSLAGGELDRSMASAEVTRRLEALLEEGISSAHFSAHPAGFSQA